MANNENIKRALHPKRFMSMSPKMGAIVGYIIEANYVTPKIVEMVVTSDGILMGRIEDDIGCNEILGYVDEFKRNWNTLIHVPGLGLSSDEVKYLEVLPSVMIRNYGE